MSTHKPVIQLFYADGAGLILPWNSGVVYSNQTGGHGCLHPEVEGIYVPLFPEGSPFEKALEDFFTGPKWQGWCCEGIDEETADVVDAALAEADRTQGLKVNRDLLEDSHEAWIHLILPDFRQSPPFSLMKGFHAMDAILTWSNSD